MTAAKPGAGAAGKTDALNRGRQSRRPAGTPSAQPLPDMPDPAAASATSATSATSSSPARPAGRAPDGHGRRGHMRKMTLELAPEEHDRLKVWLVNAFGGDVKATPVIKALLAEAYADPSLTDRIRRRLL